MSSSFDNIHPGLSQAGSLQILSTPVSQLDSMSDYYMAASHLINFPGQETEQALTLLVETDSEEQALVLARRKAVEVLARLGCKAAIPAIGNCLRHQDHYLVENAAWALQELGSEDVDLHQIMISLLRDPSQNRRVLIQSLAALGVHEALSQIEILSDDDDPGVRGAALSALARLVDRRDRLDELEAHLTLPNQMNRQSAIQDVIDCGGFDLLDAVLGAPVSPVFRMRAVRSLWPDGVAQHHGLNLEEVLDGLLLDHPDRLTLVHQYDEPPTNEFLVQEFFGTDFSRCYLALKTLAGRSAEEIWPILDQRWCDEADNDYGAHYFFIRLFGSRLDWPLSAREKIEEIVREAIDNRRPQFMKSRPAAILAMITINSEICKERFSSWISEEMMSFWECRYAALLAVQDFVALPDWQDVKSQLELSESDANPYVRFKALCFKSRFVA